MICPYCDVDVNENAVESEDGCCPECGMLLSPTSLFENPSDFEIEDVDELEEGEPEVFVYDFSEDEELFEEEEEEAY
jgi:hypothetical protein